MPGRRFFFLFLLVLGGGCQEPPASQQAKLRLASSSAPTTLDPRKCGDYLSSTLTCLLYEGLTRPLPGGGWEKALAEEIEEREGGRVFLFHLRDAVWSDGTPITAYDFEASWRQVIDPTFPSPFRYLLYPIQNGKRCAEGILSPEALGVRALSEKLLQVELERPTPHFLALTGFPLLLPTPLHQEVGERGPFSGPFQIGKSSPLGDLFLVKNRRYWRRDQIFLEEIALHIIPDEGTALQLFCQGELDWIGSPLSPLPQEAIEAPPPQGRLEFHPMAATTFCTFNTSHPLLSHPKVRRALSLAIDREEIVGKLSRSGQIAAYSPLPPPLSLKHSFPPSKESPLPLFEEGLAELKIKKEELHLTLSFRSGQLERRLAQVLQKQWEENLGLRVSLQEVDPKTHLYHLQERRYEIALSSWIAHLLDPLNLLERLAEKGNPKNYPGWENGLFSQLLQEALSSSSEKRASLLAKAEELLLGEAPLAPLYHWANPSLSSKRLAPLESHAMGGLLFERGYFEGFSQGDPKFSLSKQ